MPLVLSMKERAYLERQVRRRRVARSLSERCRVILRCADGLPSKDVAAELGLHEHTVLGRLIRDIRRKIAGEPELEAAFERPLASAEQIRSQQQRQRGWKLYSFHAPEVQCIAHRARSLCPCPVRRQGLDRHHQPGGQFVLHAKGLPGNPYDGSAPSSTIRRS